MTDFFSDEQDSRAARRRRRIRRRRFVALVIVVAMVAIAAAAAVFFAGCGGEPASDEPAASVTAENAGPTASATPSLPSISDTASPAASATIPTPSGTPRLRRPTKRDPLAVYFGGDSLSGMPGIMLAQLADETGLMDVHVDYQESSRLTVPDPIDWPARLHAQMKAKRYDVAVFLIGINDPGMPMTADGEYMTYPKKAWLDEYRERAGELMTEMRSGGVQRVYWAGLPTMPTAGQTAAVKRLNELFQTAAAQHADVVYVDTYTPLATMSGAFNGALRSGDGVHYTNEGAERVAAAVWAAMRRDWRGEPLPSSPRPERWAP